MEQFITIFVIVSFVLWVGGFVISGIAKDSKSNSKTDSKKKNVWNSFRELRVLRDELAEVKKPVYQKTQMNPLQARPRKQMQPSVKQSVKYRSKLPLQPPVQTVVNVNPNKARRSLTPIQKVVKLATRKVYDLTESLVEQPVYKPSLKKAPQQVVSLSKHNELAFENAKRQVSNFEPRKIAKSFKSKNVFSKEFSEMEAKIAKLDVAINDIENKSINRLSQNVSSDFALRFNSNRAQNSILKEKELESLKVEREINEYLTNAENARKRRMG